MSTLGHLQARSAHRPTTRGGPPPWWLAPLLAVGPALVLLIRVRHFAINRDEAATIYAATVDAEHFAGMLGHTDAIFAPYYLLIRAVVGLGDPLLVARSVSILGYAVTVGLTAALGARVARLPGLLVAGVAVAANPLLLTEAQTARPYPLATACVVGAVLCAYPASPRPAARLPWAAVGCAVAACWLHLFAAIPLACMALAVVGLRPGLVRSPRLLVQAGTLLVLVAPVAALGVTQRGQISWIEPTTWSAAVQELVIPMVFVTWAPAGTAGTILLVGAKVAAPLLLAAVALAAVRGLAPGSRPRALLIVTVAWLVGAPVALVLVSLVVPVLTAHYVTFSTPAVGVLAAFAVRAGAARWGRAAVAGYLVIAAVIGAGTLRALPLNDDFRGAAAYLNSHARPNDVVVMSTSANRTAFKPDLRAPVALWPARDASLLQRWNVDESWRPAPDVTVWVAGVHGLDQADLRRFEQGLIEAGYRRDLDRWFGSVLVTQFLPPGGR